MGSALNWTDEAVETRMRQGWPGGLKGGTPCGVGCLPKYTQNIRKRLPALLQSYGIESICDAGAGDLIWAKETFVHFDYKAFDLVPRVPGVAYADITKDRLPACDAILCRAVLIHLDPPRIQAALELFRKSAKFLLASQYDVVNKFDSNNQFNRTNLAAAPYSLGEPLAWLRDLEDGKSKLALWNL